MNALIDRISKAYDEVPYTSAAFTVSAPEHLRAVAHLFGLDAPVPERARVLELGCAAGGNLIPFAVRHPGAEVVGIDLSPVQIDIGRNLVEAMGLKNVRLIQGSIADVGQELGKFDYIVCHGVYSWVPEDVRAAILRVCSERLTPDGVAYVSYNTYPGWKAKEIVRDAMLLRAGDRAAARERLAYARGIIEFLHEQAKQGTVLSTVMGEHIDMIRDGEDYYLSHEYLELCNAPCYFKDFVSDARAQDLEYLGDATVATMFASNYGTAAAPALLAECGGDQVVLEQLLDFLQNRTFRQSLLVHADRGAKIRYQLVAERIANLHVAGRYAKDDTGANGMVHWTYSGGATVSTYSPVTGAVIEQLNAAWPATVPVAELLATCSEGDTDRVLELVTNLIVGNAVRFRSEPVVPGTLGDKPAVRPELRKLAAAGDHPVVLFTEWHQPAKVAPMERFLLPLLSGDVDAEQLVGAVQQAVEQGGLRVTRDGETLTDPIEVLASIRGQVNSALGSLAVNAMLCASPVKAEAASAKPVGKSVDKASPKPAKAANTKAAKPTAKTEAPAKPAAKPEAPASSKPSRPPRGKK